MPLIGGIRPPVAVLSVVLLLIAAFTALGLGAADRGGIARTVLTSQQHVAEDGAIALRASLDEGSRDLTRTAALFSDGPPVGADDVLDELGDVYQKWRGIAVVGIESGRLLAARGENVPLSAVHLDRLSDEDGLTPRLVRLENGETRLLTFALLSWPGKPQQLLVASSNLRVPAVSLGSRRSMAVLDADGRILGTDGKPLSDIGSRKEDAAADRTRQELSSFARTAVRKAAQHPATAKAPGAGGYPGVSGSLLGGAGGGERTVAGYAALAGAEPGEQTGSTRLGLTVLAMVPVADDPTRAGSPLFGLAAAGALIVIGGLVVLLLRARVQRPVLALFLESRRLSRGDLRRPVRVPRSGEAARTGAALELLRRQLLGEPLEAQQRVGSGRGLGSRALLALCAALLLAWSVPLVVTTARPDPGTPVPDRIVHDQLERTDTLSDRTRRALNEGQADLASLAARLGKDTTPDRMKAALRRTMDDHPRYQSLYVTDSAGSVGTRVGDSPQRRPGKSLRDGRIAVLNDEGKQPVVAAFAAVDRRKGEYVVGEFRIDFLGSLLSRPGLGEVRVVDADHRVIASNRGFRAFEKLSGKPLGSLVDRMNRRTDKDSRAGARRYRDGGLQIAAAAPFTGGGPAKSLRWTVVSHQPAAVLITPESELQRRITLAGLLGLTAAAGCLGWLHIVVVRPLRTLARQAGELAGGDRRTVLYPQHHDEVGAVVRSLELIRRQLQDHKSAPRTGVRIPAGRD